jgi:hypothetical protein
MQEIKFSETFFGSKINDTLKKYISILKLIFNIIY